MMAQQQKMGSNPMGNMMMPGMGMGGGMPGMGQQVDPNQKVKEMFNNMVENISVIQHKFAYDKCPEAAEKKLQNYLKE